MSGVCELLANVQVVGALFVPVRLDDPVCVRRVVIAWTAHEPNGRANSQD
jgi:hypothetical protein